MGIHSIESRRHPPALNLTLLAWLLNGFGLGKLGLLGQSLLGRSGEHLSHLLGIKLEIDKEGFSYSEYMTILLSDVVYNSTYI